MNKTMNNEKQHVLNDLLLVGKEKVVGYLPLDTLTEFCETSVEDIIAYTVQNGLSYALYSEEESSVYSGAIFVYDPTSFSAFARDYQSSLNEAGVPCDTATHYVNHIAKHSVSQRKFPNAYLAVAKSFNDPRFK